MTDRPLEVSLPFCPTCGHVGSIPLSGWHGKMWCQGAEGNRHSKVKMLSKTFVEKKP